MQIVGFLMRRLKYSYNLIMRKSSLTNHNKDADQLCRNSAFASEKHSTAPHHRKSEISTWKCSLQWTQSLTTGRVRTIGSVSVSETKWTSDRSFTNIWSVKYILYGHSSSLADSKNIYQLMVSTGDLIREACPEIVGLWL